MKVRLIKPAVFAPFHRAEFPGVDFECSSDEGKKLVEAGLAEEVKTVEKPQPPKKKNGNK